MDKFKAYQQQMERALRAFENTSEWADLVNALGKVNKVLSNHPQISKIPCDAILGRRLAQCLHPGLPNGVGLKALETYDLLFKAIGSDNLVQELSKYSNGLFPLLSHADLNVKPALLELYEVHFLPLKERLRPALDGFLIATLHGLEENTDFFQRTDKLLVNVCQGVGAEHFYGSLWRCILIDPSVRLHGMNFLITHFNKKRPLEQQLYILGNSQEALIEAICVSLLDVRNVLVQRAALDLLLCCFPLHNQQISRHEMMKIVTGAVTVLLRRDTSLSRRLLSWIFSSNSAKKTSSTQTSPSSMGPESRKSREYREKERRSQYFEEYSKSLLLDAFKNCLWDPSKIIDIPNCWSSLGDYWCYRLLICLIDHSEMCELILDDLCLEILRALCSDFRRPENQRPEIRTVRLLMNSMNISYLWNRVYTLLRQVCDERKNLNNNDSSLENNENDNDRKSPIYQNQLQIQLQMKQKMIQQQQKQQQKQKQLYNVDGELQEEVYVKPVGAGPTNILELCAFYDFMLDCFPIENYVEVAKEFMPKILINLLNLMIDHCDTLTVSEYLALNRVVSNIFEGISSIHKESASLERAEAIQNRLNRIPTPLESNAISSVAEDEECIPDEIIGETNDSLINGGVIGGTNNMIDDQNHDKSASDQNAPSSLQQQVGITGATAMGEPETPALEGLIDKFQQQFHVFVSKRLIKFKDSQQQQQQQQQNEQSIEPIYEESGAFLERSPLQAHCLPDIQYLDYDTQMVSVYESQCRIATLIAAIPNVQEHLDSNGSELGVDEDIIGVGGSPLMMMNRNWNSTTNYNNNQQHHQQQQQLHQEGRSACRPYILDLILLSYKVDNIRINYASMRLLVDMLTKSQLTLDPEFAVYNQPVEFAPPSFSEEITASVAGETLPLNLSQQNKLSSDRLLLLNDEFFYIVRETCWFSLAMKILWNNLSSEPMMWPETVDLIQNIHNLTHQNFVCEDIICATLNDVDEQIAYEARRRFILLFSLMKNDKSDLKLRNREFERPLFFMLDSLANKMEAFNCIARDWLTQVYKNKTTYRVLEPIMKILLQPDTARNPIIFTKIHISSIHHTHMYLYNQVYDSKRILYALNTLWNVLTTDPEQGLMRMASSSIKNCHHLHMLYVRHCNVLAGNNFHDEISIDARGQVPSFLELTIVICLNFLSGHYVMQGSSSSSSSTTTTTTTTKSLPIDEIRRNQKVRMLACEILRTIFSNLFEAIKDCPPHPIHDMLNRCRVQEIVLQHIATLVQCAQKSASSSSTPTSGCSTLAGGLSATTYQQLSLAGGFSSDNQYNSLSSNLTTNTTNTMTSNSNSTTPTAATATTTSIAPSTTTTASTATINNNLTSNLNNNNNNNNNTVEHENSSDQLIYFNETSNENSDDFQRTLLRLLEELMILEFKVAPPNVISETENHSRSARTRDIPDLSSNSLKYFQNILISSQRLFLSTVKAALQNMQRSDLHVNWLSLIEATISISGRSLTRWISCVISRLCDNLELISNCILNKCEPISIKFSLTPEYLSILLNSLSFLAQYWKEVYNKLSQIILALIQVWKAIGLEQSSWIILGSPSEVKKQILALLSPISLQHGPQFMYAISHVWHELKSRTPSRKVIPICSPDQKLLVEIVASISDLPMELVLQTTRQVISKKDDDLQGLLASSAASGAAGSNSLNRVPLEVGLLQFFLAYIRLYPGSQLIECWKPLIQLLRDGLQLSRPAMPQAQFTLLALLHEFVQTAPLIEDRKDQKDLQDVSQKLIDSVITVAGGRLYQTRWLRRALEVEPGPQWDMDEVSTLGDFNCNNGPHSLLSSSGLGLTSSSITSTLTSSSSAAAAAATAASSTATSLSGPMSNISALNNQHLLLHTTDNNSLSDVDSNAETISESNGPSSLSGPRSSTTTITSAAVSTTTATAPAQTTTSTTTTSSAAASNTSNAIDETSYLARFNVSALNALAEYVAPVLDVVYASDEKEKTTDLFYRIRDCIIPYLKNHQQHNAPSFLACSELLSSISGYTYTRKAWRKEALDLLLDPQFFHMESHCMEHWRTIVDHLMTHDKSTFTEFLSRMSFNQPTGALKIFVSRDQENELRAQLIKRMAFVLFCSERDHYHKYTPEIQEKLIESLRDNPPDSVQLQIILCFRVLILRSSAHLLTSLWPYVYTEIVQGLLDIESYIEQSGSNLQATPATAARLQLFLYTCKLVDTILALPADSLPQFQMYRWSFIGSGDDFEPHLVRIERRLTELSQCPTLLPYRNHYPVLTLRKIDNLLDLHPFFKTLVKVNRGEYPVSEQTTAYESPLKFMDMILESDFLG